MADVHEEAQLGFTHFLGMHVGLKAHAVARLTLLIAVKQADEHGNRQQIDHVGRRRTIPRCLYFHRESLHFRRHIVIHCLHPKGVIARRKMAEHDLVHAGLQSHPGFFVDAVEVGDVVRVVVCEG